MSLAGSLAAQLPSGAARDSINRERIALAAALQEVPDSEAAHCADRKNCAIALKLWGQARGWLLAAATAREATPARLRRLLFERKLDGNSERVVATTVRVDTVDTRANPLLPMHPPQDVGRFGFADDPRNSASYYALDPDVLLTAGFTRAYGIELAAADSKRAHQVGIRFVADDQRAGRVDIDGTLWVDTAAHELRGMDYRYVGIPRTYDDYRLGGDFEFATASNGVTLVDRWSVRLVKATKDTVLAMSNSRRGGYEMAQRTWLYAVERGGDVARATWRDGTDWRDSLGTIRVRAATTRGLPARGSVLALAGTPFYGNADSTGTTDIRGVLPGRYAVRAIDRRIAVAESTVPTPLQVTATRDATTTATLKVPTAEEFIAARCKAAHDWTVGDSVFVFGRLVAPNGNPISGAKVTFADSTRQWRSGSVVTGADGLFESCKGWKVGDDVLIHVHRTGAADAELTRTISSTILAIRFIAGALSPKSDESP